MLRVILLILLAGFASWSIYGASALIRVAVSDWKSWYQSRSSPIIDAEDGNLSEVQPEWPLKEIRWPSPVSLKNGQMSPIRSRAYARAAASRAQSLRIQAEAWILFGAALMGWRIPIFVAQVLTPNPAPAQAELTDFIETGQQILPLVGVILMVAVGLNLRQLSDNYGSAQRYYEQTAEATIKKKELVPLASRPFTPMWKKIITGFRGR